MLPIDYNVRPSTITKTEQTFESLLNEASEFNDVVQIRFIVEKLK